MRSEEEGKRKKGEREKGKKGREPENWGEAERKIFRFSRSIADPPVPGRGPPVPTGASQSAAPDPATSRRVQG